MNNKLLLAISLSAACSNVFSSPLFDVPLAKKCYAVYQEVVSIEEVQTTYQCINELDTAKINIESAALSIAEDDLYPVKYFLEYAINALKHAQVYGCVDEDKIMASEIKLTEIKSLIE